ncbi:MAG: epoxyqueuosine reductase [Ruminococcaceae bacterium]|nr:epoxyqueuosine reductase [Oscillospiraceae bacterium]
MLNKDIITLHTNKVKKYLAILHARVYNQIIKKFKIRKQAFFNMKEKLREYFLATGIEYFSVLDYASCIETGARIIERASLTPRSVILYLLPYYTTETVNLSRYAASLDYHLAIRTINEGLEKILKEKFPDSKTKGYGDHSPIDERHAALISGLGIAGDNGLIINEKYGSYVFVGDVVTDIPAEQIGAILPMEIIHCEHCGACKRACPTGILRGVGEDCLSAITQKKGTLTKEEERLMQKYNTLWGCDYCQSVCPHNKNPKKTPVAFFYENPIAELTGEILDSMSDEEFSRRAFAWRKRATVSRNIDILNKKQT